MFPLHELLGTVTDTRQAFEILPSLTDAEETLHEEAREEDFDLFGLGRPCLDSFTGVAGRDDLTTNQHQDVRMQSLFMEALDWPGE